MTLRIPQTTCAQPTRQEGTVVVARCGWRAYQEGTVLYCTCPYCPAYHPRGRELQALKAQLDLTEAVEKLAEMIGAFLAKKG